MSTFLKIGGWIIAMIAIVLAGLLGHQLKTAQVERDLALQKLAARDKQVEELARLDKETKAKADELQRKLEETGIAMELPEGESGLIAENGALAEDDAPANGAAAPSFFESIAGMMKGEKGAGFAKATAGMQAQMQYGKLFKELNLPPDVEEQALAVVSGKLETEMLAGVDMLSGERTVDPEQAKKDDSDAQQRVRAELSKILTPEELAQYDEYEQELPRHALEQQYEMELSMYGASLTEESRTLITQTLVEEVLTAVPDFGKPGSKPPANPAIIFEGQLTAVDRAQERLAAELDETEFAQAERFLNRQRQQAQVFIDMMNSIMPAPKEPAKP